MGCDSPAPVRAPRACCFNPRTRVGCDASIPAAAGSALMFQSTHPRGVRLFFDDKDSTFNGVSIHAPAWGATLTARAASTSRTCFNPRTRVGCDRLSSLQRSGCIQFQSTHPRGVRRNVYRNWTGQKTFQSTHPRGVRRTSSRPRSRRCRSFNPRTRVGCDNTAGPLSSKPALFQSTHPRGVRRSAAACSRGCGRCFNPRTRVGCDCFHVLSSRFP